MPFYCVQILDWRGECRFYFCFDAPSVRAALDTGISKARDRGISSGLASIDDCNATATHGWGAEKKFG